MYTLMRRFSLLTRLSLSHTLVTLAGLALLGTTLLVLIRNAQSGQMSSVLRERAQIYAAYAATIADDTDALASLAPTFVNGFGLNTDTTLRILAPNGGVLFASRSLGPFPSRAALQYLTDRLPIQPVAFDEDRRFVAVPVIRNGQTIGIVELSRSLRQEQAFIRQITVALLPSVLLALAGAAIGGHLLARTLVRPLDRLGQVAKAVAGGDLHVRSDDHSPDEIGQLAARLNRMTDELEARLAEVERLAAARQQFYRTVSHELRTPLTAIRGAAENLEDDALPEQQASLHIIQQEAARLQRLVEELLNPRDAVPLPIRQRHRVDLGALIDDVCKIMQNRAERSGIMLEASASNFVVWGDEDRLKQAFLNLLDNALTWTPVGGKVTIAVQDDGNSACILVRDTGPGIVPHLRENIWERGVSTSGGQGLGLAFVREIIEAHNGTVTLLDGPHTTIALQLPLWKEES